MLNPDVWPVMALVVAIVVAVVLVTFAGAVVLLLFRGKIDIHDLLAEADGKASLSRFQFLLFTFVIAGLYFLLCVEAGTLIEIPASVLGVLGISAGGYVTAKMVTAGKDVMTEKSSKEVDNKEAPDNTKELGL